MQCSNTFCGASTGSGTQPVVICTIEPESELLVHVDGFRSTAAQQRVCCAPSALLLLAILSLCNPIFGVFTAISLEINMHADFRVSLFCALSFSSTVKAGTTRKIGGDTGRGEVSDCLGGKVSVTVLVSLPGCLVQLIALPPLIPCSEFAFCVCRSGILDTPHPNMLAAQII